MSRLKWMIAVSGIVAASVIVSGQEAAKQGTKMSITDLGKMRNEDRIHLLSELTKERSDLASVLIAQVKTSTDKDVKCAAIYLLGCYRIEKAAAPLAAIVSFEATVGLHDEQQLWDMYPAAEALAKIGNPAVPEMVKNIETSEDAKVRELSAGIISHVEGMEVGKFILEKAAEKQTEETKKARLKAAIESMK